MEPIEQGCVCMILPLGRDGHVSTLARWYVLLALFYVSFGFPMSWIADRTSRRNVIVASLISWSVMTTCFGMARTYWQLLAARIGVGIGEAGGTPSASSIISDYFPAGRRWPCWQRTR